MPQSKKQVAPKKLKKATTSKELKLQEAEVMRQRELVKNVLFPFLISNSKSITEAKRLCYEVQQILTQEFQKKVSEYQKTLSDVLTNDFSFEDIIKKGEGFKVDKALVSLFAKEKLSVTNSLLQGMQTALDSFVAEELNGRNLTSLKTKFL